MLITAAGALFCDITAAGLSSVAEPGKRVLAPRGIEIGAGGHPANVTVDLIKLGLPRNLLSVVGFVGDDFQGRFLKRHLKACGIVAHVKTIKNERTSTAMLIVIKGEDRRAIYHPGASSRLDPRFIERVLCAENPAVFYVGLVGTLGDADRKLDHLLRKAKKLGCLTFVDPVPPPPLEGSWDFLLRACRFIDIFHCNDVEILDITGEERLEDGILSLTDLGIQLPVVTLGPRGLITYAHDEFLKMGAFRVNAIDPTGAGDAFCAGLIYKLIEDKGVPNISDVTKKELINALTFASAAGAIATTREGTTTAVNLRAITELIARQGEGFLNSCTWST